MGVPPMALDVCPMPLGVLPLPLEAQCGWNTPNGIGSAANIIRSTPKINGIGSAADQLGVIPI